MIGGSIAKREETSWRESRIVRNCLNRREVSKRVPTANLADGLDSYEWIQALKSNIIRIADAIMRW
jgi:hypothetical protein